MLSFPFSITTELKHLVLVKKGVVVIPKSVTSQRITSNLHGSLLAFSKLEPADMESLDGVAAGGMQTRYIKPPWGNQFVIFLLFPI